MMKLKEIESKSILVKSGLSTVDYVVNPYIGCMHGCIFCYARFMKRFTGHKEEWGQFVDAKVNAADLVKNGEKYRGKSVFFCSTTDPYHPPEARYKLTRQVLEKLIPHQPNISVQSKSDLIVRDIDLFKQFKHIIAGISISTLDESIQKKVEPLASSPKRRIAALKKMKKSGLKTYCFVSPIFPGITNWKAILRKTKSFVDEYWFENLNFYPSIRANMYNFLEEYDPKLVDKYREIYTKGNSYWYDVEKEIASYCKKNKIKCKIYFHHKSMTK
ncbi:radical SAM protein [Candidatus Woesearchaeota archaeon]|jgi:DNA repair photolyase|nr:radical SAM protein [Candidatus Woesearchaeota archaeon]MBT4114456.1 radical SAM protein [Candidatus Woesearchaeota archaeon]MBT4248224.1 radical SAM protein [Candidatus Woesearchaeota archaeon]